jgi:hypothetical protein
MRCCILRAINFYFTMDYSTCDISWNIEMLYELCGYETVLEFYIPKIVTTQQLTSLYHVERFSCSYFSVTYIS